MGDSVKFKIIIEALMIPGKKPAYQVWTEGLKLEGIKPFIKLILEDISSGQDIFLIKEN